MHIRSHAGPLWRALGMAALLSACGEGSRTDRAAQTPKGGTVEARGSPSIVPAESRMMLPDAPALDQIRGLDRTLIGVVEYKLEGLVSGYPLVERDTHNFKFAPTAPQGARARISELPSTSFEGRTVACGEKHVRIECYDDDTIDIVVTERRFTTDWYEMEDGSRIPADRLDQETKEARSRHLFHVTPGGEYTIQSLVKDKTFARTHESGADVLFAYVPWSLVEQAAAWKGANVQTDQAGRVKHITAIGPRGTHVTIQCNGWEEQPIRHPRTLETTERRRDGGDVLASDRFVKLSSSDGP